MSVILVLALAGGHTTAAADAVFDSTPVWTGTFLGTLGVALGDVDGDGDLDLVTGRLYLNQGGTFATTPTWFSRSTPNSVALGDVDGDGNLDVVCANFIAPSRLYLNQGGTFATTSAWSSVSTDANTVALGDVDGDGDLDLVFGNDGAGATVYLNTGGSFSATPDWTGPAAPTRSVALADVDDDGVLDLICGNYGQGSALYLNIGGTFAATPAWTGPAEYTKSVALGDVDGDGDFDLVCGSEGPGATLYLNIGGTFSAAPVWTGPVEFTSSVALGDVDADGDLDLIRGNFGQGSTVYLNIGGTFAATPAWTGPAEDTRSVALGDIDGDGELDLVRGNFVGGSTLYRNVGGSLASAPAWTGPGEHTFSIALGDVDADGDLDLILGNYGEGTTLHLNTGGAFDPTPAWNGPGAFTRGVALGDIDGDGYLDLVFGNHDQSPKLYLNAGGTFAATAAWAGPILNTTSVALGDIDGDGNLDLVLGNDGQGAKLLLNTGGTFQTVPIWQGPIASTYAVALGDVDGDGDLDLVIGNYGQASELYLNTGGTFAKVPAWTGPMAFTSSVALGDVDGDGDLDLVMGHAGQGATLYLNTGGTFAASPAWTGPAEDTQSLALGDIDGDGDLDLVRGNNTSGTTLYLNSGGRFTATPAWTARVENTRSVALGDMDADGDLDLVCGNVDQGGTLYLTKNPWIDTLGRSVRHLPNNPAHVGTVNVAPADSNLYRISFQAFDREEDPLWVLGEFQFAGVPQWHPMDVAGSDLRAGPFSTSLAGIRHELLWNVSRLPFDRRAVVVRLRALSPPRHTGVIQFLPSYTAQIGRVTPARAEAQVSPGALAFSAVTVGDSMAAALRISNRGTRNLRIDRVESPDAAVTVRGDAGLIVPPGASRDVEVQLAPRGALPGVGPLQLFSNDPITPELDIPMTLDVRALQVHAELFATEPELPLGEAVTVLVAPAESVHVERGFLFFRSVRRVAEDYDSTSIKPLGAQFLALIPGEHVTEGGLDYYVRVENSGIFSFDPPTAPAVPFCHQVASPQGIASQVREDDAGGHQVGRSVHVAVSVPQGALQDTARVLFRPGGGTAYDTTHAVVFPPGVTTADIALPADAAGPRGLEYRVSVNTLTRTLNDPADPLAPPHVIRTDVSNLTEESPHAGGHYRMLSVPLELNLPAAASLDALLADDLGGSYDPTRWRSFRYIPEDSAYLEIPTSGAPSPKLRSEHGRAFWLIAKDGYRMDTDPIGGRSIPTDSSFRVTLSPGWNQIGDPFLFPVAWRDVGFEGLATGVTIEPPVAWDEAAGKYRNADTDTLRPFDGYWVKNRGATTVTLLVPPHGAGASPQTTSIARDAASPRDSIAWQLQISSTSGASSDSRNIAGVASLANEGADALDRSDPPLAPGEALSLYFLAEDSPHARLTADLRAPIPASDDDDARGRRWLFDLARSGDDVQPRNVRLSFHGIESIQREYDVRLIDRVLARSTDLRAQDDYSYASAARDYVARAADARFVLVVGTRAFVGAAPGAAGPPRVTRLMRSYPNPVTSSSLMRFELAHPGHVTLALYDIAGRNVRTLVDDARLAGRHELLWHGDDDAGRSLPPGVYALRLVAPDRTDVRKLVRTR